MDRVLVVDDDPPVLGLFSRILTKGGYSVLTADSGAKALLKLKGQESYDAMVLDLNMPEPDGFEILKTIRTVRPGLRVIVISGYLDGALLKASEILGASASLNKVDAPTQLLKTVNALLR